ncbi:hypothetical protein, partial [Salmonella enterica]|uniref:hypothetical protein n=1 Tax=Salmonella enterica TaxID=28901 RepID=UPI0032999252
LFGTTVGGSDCLGDGDGHGVGSLGYYLGCGDRGEGYSLSGGDWGVSWVAETTESGVVVCSRSAHAQSKYQEFHVC